MNRALRPWRGTGIRPWDDLYKEMDQLVQQFLGDENRTPGNSEFVPHVNIAETDAAYEVTADLPGLKPEDVQIEIHDGQLTISGKRQSESEQKGKTFHRVERRYGEFRRVIGVPATVDEKRITADFHDGVLRVSLPKSEKVKPTRIQIGQTAS